MALNQNLVKELQQTIELLQSQTYSEIEKDIVLEKLRAVYVEVKNNNFVEENIVEQQQTESFDFEENTQEVKEDLEESQADIIQEVAAQQQEFFEETRELINEVVEELKAEEPIILEEISEEVELPIEIEIQEEPVETEVIEVEAESDSKIIIEVVTPPVASQQPTTNIRQDLSQKLSKKPVSNIATAIGINERFQFINELFGKDADAYSATIEELNGLSNFAEALDLLQTRFSWDYENQLVERFVSIVERRYL